MTVNGVNGNHVHETRRPILRVGLIGCGEISQVAHIPNLNHISDKFVTTYICDVSQQALLHCAAKVAPGSPKTTTDAEVLCSSDEVDVVVIATADAFHVPHAILALKYDKYCLLEKPAALNYRDIDALSKADFCSRGKVFVGYMRRYSLAFLEAVKEVKQMQNIRYARVRDIIGPNSDFVNQSGTFPRKFGDITKEDIDDLNDRQEDIFDQALTKEFGIEATPSSKLMLRILGGLGSHDLSAMRELLGMPKSCLAASFAPPGIWTALFQYDGFPVTYESGFNKIPTFDCCIEVFSDEKIIRIDFDTPYIKGLPITLTIREKVEGDFGSSGFQERVIRPTYEDAYALEFDAFYECVLSQGTPKTTVADARNDIDLYAMVLKAGQTDTAR